MNQYCDDRDLLAVEPVIFTAGGFPSQRIASGQGGTFAGTVFSADGGGFVSAGVRAGMVLVTYTTIPAEGGAWEIVSADSASELTVSVLRAEAVDSPIAPPGGGGLLYLVPSYAAQIANVSQALGEKLRQVRELASLSRADFADSSQLRMAAAHGVLADVFLARAAAAEPQDANWLKARHYRQLFVEAQTHLRLAADDDGDGSADRTRSLGNVTLRRD
jgi:hypothetical protein